MPKKNSFFPVGGVPLQTVPNFFPLYVTDTGLTARQGRKSDENQGRKNLRRQCQHLKAKTVTHTTHVMCLVTKPTIGANMHNFKPTVIFITLRGEKSEPGHETFSWWTQMGAGYVPAQWQEWGLVTQLLAQLPVQLLRTHQPIWS